MARPEGSELPLPTIVVEGVDETLAPEITAAVKAPTIGIGASAQCDGQILVTDDMLGLFEWTPKFVRRYADLKGVIDKAAAARCRGRQARLACRRFLRGRVRLSSGRPGSGQAAREQRKR